MYIGGFEVARLDPPIVRGRLRGSEGAMGLVEDAEYSMQSYDICMTSSSEIGGVFGGHRNSERR